MEKDISPNGSRGDIGDIKTPSHGILKHKEKSGRSIGFQPADVQSSDEVSPKHGANKIEHEDE